MKSEEEYMLILDTIGTVLYGAHQAIEEGSYDEARRLLRAVMVCFIEKNTLMINVSNEDELDRYAAKIADLIDKTVGGKVVKIKTKLQ
jgi:hypothetical protein